MSQCLFPIYRRVRENSMRPQIHLLDAISPHRNTSGPCHNPPSLATALLGLSCKELLPALLLCHLGWICASIELALHLTETMRGSHFAVT